MKANGEYRRSVTGAGDRSSIEILDQRALPHALLLAKLVTLQDVACAIREMWVRGAPLIGAVAAYGLCFAVREDPSDAGIEAACRTLLATRPTAVNLRWALDEIRTAILAQPPARRFDVAWDRAQAICEEDVAINRAIGSHGVRLLREIVGRKERGARLNVLTHCNAGWLATVDWGTALAPVYMAHDSGMQLHVWVSETRPRVQGALTAWELAEHGVPHTVVVDNAAGHLLSHKMVDVCIVGADRVSTRGDVCNKVGTYLKALAARENGVPFYAAVPHPTIDWTLADGMRAIPIEERDPEEVQCVGSQRLYPEASPAANYAFDVTPAELVTGLVTERGIAPATEAGLLSLYPERSTSLRPPLTRK